MEDKIGQAQSAQLTRSDFLKRTAAAGVGLSLLSGVQAVGALAASTATQTVRWISPRGTLDVMDDFDLWVPIKMGYFSKLGINAKLIAGPIGDALACTKFVAQNQADMGYPSPGVLTASIDSGIPVKSIWDMISGPGLRLRAAGEQLDHERQATRRARRSRSGSAGWSTIVDPILVGVGLDPKTVTYVNAGNQWAQSVESGQADAGLAWEGLRAQWAGQGLKLKYLIGTTFSKQPSNVYSVRADDLNDSTKVDLYTRFLQGMIMGLEFAQGEPAGRRADHLHLAAGAAEVAEAAGGVRLVRRAGDGVRHLAPRRSGLGLALPGRMGRLSRHRPQPRADEEAARRVRRVHELARHGGEQEGRHRDGGLRREGVQAERDLPGRRPGPPQHLDDSDVGGASCTSEAPLAAREDAMANPLAGHTNSYHTYGFDEALAGIAEAGFKHVELSAVPGWTEHVDLDDDPAEVRQPRRRATASRRSASAATRTSRHATGSSTGSERCAGRPRTGSRS